MAAPAQTQGEQSGTGVGRVAAGTALATTVASLLPPAAGAAAGALTVTQIAQATTALLMALRRFQMMRGKAFDDQLRQEALTEEPTMGDVIDQIISRELGYEVTFRAKQYDRMQAAVGPALAIDDPAKRDAAIKALFEQERRYTKMREEAMRLRTLASVRHYHLEQASPQGAYWILGTGVKQHTLDCLAMANQFWPWSVLHAFQPPVHPRCACSLLSLSEAVRGGLMTPEQVPDEMSAVQHAHDLLRDATNAIRDGKIKEADIERYLTSLEEAPWSERFAAGTEHGGEFRPKVGGDPGARILRKLMPDRHPLSTSDRGQWQTVKGRSYRILLGKEWKRQIGGEVYHSPAGTTNVYRGGELLSTPALSGEQRSTLHEKVAGLIDRARARYSTRRGMPLRPGDGPEAVLSMEDRGFSPHLVSPHGPGAWRISYHHETTGATVNAVIGKDGKVTHADMDPSPILEQHPKVSPFAPHNFRQHTADAMAWAHELGAEHGAGVRITGLNATRTLEDHAGLRQFDGRISLGHEVESDIDRAGKARAAGRELTDDEKRGVWSAYWTTAHEVSHSVNPEQPDNHIGEGGSLEEALAEEMAHPLARERLRAQGQHDVVRWALEHPDEIAVKGVYRRERGALADILDRAGVTEPQARADAIRSLKFHVDPATRFRVLGAMVAAREPGMSVEQGEEWARQKMRKGGRKRSAIQASPGFLPEEWKPKWGKHKGKHPKASTLFDKPKAESKPKPPPVIYGGDVPAPAKQGPIPSYEHIPLEVGGKAFDYGKGALKARAGGKNYVVKEHHGDRTRVGSELLANAIYRQLGVKVPMMGKITTPGGPDFSQIPDALPDEPPIDAPAGTRLSTGVIIREKDGSVTLIEPRNHYGGYVHTFPKGGVEANLTQQQNALKELWEETGLHAHITGIVGDFKGDTGVTRYYEGVRTGGEPTPSAETEAIKTVSIKDAAEMLNRDRDKEVLQAVAKMPVPKGKYADDFPPVTPGVALAFPDDGGSRFSPKGPDAGLGSGYMADALLGNWGWAGGDNLRWQDGAAVRTNHAGALEYREGGDPKEFGPVPAEAWTMRYRGAGAQHVPGEDDLRAQATVIGKKLTDKRIDQLVAAAPLDDETRQRLAATLKERVAWMRQFADGDIDLPAPASGAEARALHADAQRGLQVYPEEEQALEDYAGEPGHALDQHIKAGGDALTEDDRRVAKHLDNLLNDTKTAADSYAYIGATVPPTAEHVGKTFSMHGFTRAHTDASATRGPGRVRLMIPGGQRALFDPEAARGESDLLLPRDVRVHITGHRIDADGTPTLDAMLMPYQRPSSLPWPKSKYTSPMGQTQIKGYSSKPAAKPSSFAKGDDVVVNGNPATVTGFAGKGMVNVVLKTGKAYTVPEQILEPPEQLSELLHDRPFVPYVEGEHPRGEHGRWIRKADITPYTSRYASGGKWTYPRVSDLRAGDHFRDKTGTRFRVLEQHEDHTLVATDDEPTTAQRVDHVYQDAAGKEQPVRIKRARAKTLLLISTGHPDQVKFRHPALGRLITPRVLSEIEKTDDAEIPWAADNDFFNPGATDEAYFKMLAKIEHLKNPMWVTAPDVVGDWKGTAEKFDKYEPQVHAKGLPVALVAQDGLGSPEGLEWFKANMDRFEAVFVGGSTMWKLGLKPLEGEPTYATKDEARARVKELRKLHPEDQFENDSFPEPDGTWRVYWHPAGEESEVQTIARLAKENHKWLHVGRVNSRKRLQYSRDVLDADTVDGSGWVKFGKQKKVPQGTQWAIEAYFAQIDYEDLADAIHAAGASDRSALFVNDDGFVVLGDDAQLGRVTDSLRAMFDDAPWIEQVEERPGGAAWSGVEVIHPDVDLDDLLPEDDLEEALAELLEAEQTHTGVMVALHPPAATQKELALPGGEDPDELHVTLAFLGKQDDLDDPDGLKDTVADWAKRTPPLDGEVAGHGLFTVGPDAPVTYLSPDLPGLPAARQDLVDSLERGGHKHSRKHGFTPHMTLAYGDRAKDAAVHGGHPLHFSRASLVIGPDKHTFKLGG